RPPGPLRPGPQRRRICRHHRRHPASAEAAVRILVVDDEPSIRFSLTELLDGAGHEVREAPHAPAALALLEESPADLVISDLTMPAMDGLQLLDEVRARLL